MKLNFLTEEFEFFLKPTLLFHYFSGRIFSYRQFIIFIGNTLLEVYLKCEPVYINPIRNPQRHVKMSLKKNCSCTLSNALSAYEVLAVFKCKFFVFGQTFLTLV